MSDDKYEWLRDSPPAIDPHSVAKHNVLREYLKQYVRVLTVEPRMERLSLHVVDGFCGGGIYLNLSTNQECSGSPLLMMQAIQEVEAEINGTRIKPVMVDTKYYFIDIKQTAIDCLKTVLKEKGFEQTIDKTCFLIHGDFQQKIDGILNNITANRRNKQKARAIFVLDQYGYTLVSFETLRKIYAALPHHGEVILTFAIEDLSTYFNLKEEEQFLNILKKLGVSEADFQRLCAHLQEGKPEAKKYLQCEMAKIIHAEVGVRFITRFFVKSQTSNRAYWLIHLSNNEKAHDEMKSLHWKLGNTFRHYGYAGVQAFPEIIGYDPDNDTELTGTLDMFDFGERAYKDTFDAVTSELPAFLRSQLQPLTVTALKEKLANHTPAHSKLLKKSIITLQQHGEIEVKTIEGGIRRSENGIHGTDLILPSKQRTFFDFKGAPCTASNNTSDNFGVLKTIIS